MVNDLHTISNRTGANSGEFLGLSKHCEGYFNPINMRSSSPLSKRLKEVHLNVTQRAMFVEHHAREASDWITSTRDKINDFLAHWAQAELEDRSASTGEFLHRHIGLIAYGLHSRMAPAVAGYDGPDIELLYAQYVTILEQWAQAASEIVQRYPRGKRFQFNRNAVWSEKLLPLLGKIEEIAQIICEQTKPIF